MRYSQFYLILIFFIPLFYAPAIAQEELPDSVKFGQEHPMSTVYTHLYYLQEDNYQPQKAAEVFELKDTTKAKNLAIKLKQVLDGKGIYVDMEVIPRDPNYTDTTTNLHRYIIDESMPAVYVEKEDDGKWYYSERTVQAIPKLHKEVYPFGSDWLVKALPVIGQKKVFGLHVWQYLGIFIIVIVAFVLHRLFSYLIGFFIKKLIKSPHIPKKHRIIIHKAALPVSLMIITILLEYMVPIIQLPIKTGHWVILILDILTPVYATIAVYRLVDFLIIFMEKKAAKTKSTLDDQLIPLVSKILKIFVIATGVLFILSALDFDITALIAGMSIGGLAFALAAQDTIKNLFGSLMIFVDRPFQIGDWINFQGVDGTVEEVGFRSTRLRTFANSVVSVPNGEVANMVIDNMGLRVYRRYSAKISITYDTPPELIEKYVEGLREIVANHPLTRKDYYNIYLNEMDKASLNILFYVFFDVPDWGKELEGRHDLIMETIKLAKKLGIRFAFPTQTIHVEDFPEKKTLAPEYRTQKEEMEKGLKDFLAAYKQRYPSGGAAPASGAN